MEGLPWPPWLLVPVWVPPSPWASVSPCAQRRGSFDPGTLFRASQKYSGKSVNTQGWGSQGTAFPKWGGILGKRAGRLAWARGATEQRVKLECTRPFRGILRLACLHGSGSLLLNGCGCWTDELGLHPAGERELRHALEQKGEVLKAPAHLGSLDIQSGVEAGTPGRKGPA